MIALRRATAGPACNGLERRLNLMLLVLLIGFAFLFGRLGWLQIVRGAYYESLSRGNRIRMVYPPAPRGEIIDRDGALLATTRPAFAASLIFMGEGYSDETLATLERILDLPPGHIRELLQASRGRLHEPIRLKADINPVEHSMLEEHRHQLPGLVIEAVPIRDYPHGPLAAHALGRVGFLNSEASQAALDGQLATYESILQAGDLAPGQYRLGDIVGLIGLENQYDAILRGVDGAREVEVNVSGTPTKIGREVPPQPGLNLRLTLDIGLQTTLETALAANMERIRTSRGDAYAASAAGVVLDVKTGGVLAMASVPDFDPNWSASGRIEERFLPLEEFNRATRGLYIPGSTYKMMTAITALEEGIATEEDRAYCGGGYRIGSHFVNCWVGRPGHGQIGVVEAIGDSCNTYFLEVGARLRALARASDPDSGMVDLLSRYAPDFGLDGLTGIDLPIESAGRSPRIGARKWLPGEDLQCAIGQSRQAYSPLQLANYVATIAADGRRLRPYLVDQVLDDDRVIWRAQPESLGSAGVSAATLDVVKQGMLATTQPGGTAYSAFWDVPVRVAGKTGTAETGRKPNDGLFVGFAPFDDPQIAWVIVVERGESGALAGAPVGRELVRTYFGLDEPGEVERGERGAAR